MLRRIVHQQVDVVSSVHLDQLGFEVGTNLCENDLETVVFRTVIQRIGR